MTEDEMDQQFIMFTVSGNRVHILLLINPALQLRKPKFREAISKPSKSDSWRVIEWVLLYHTGLHNV